jgi:hypothetical protein
MDHSATKNMLVLMVQLQELGYLPRIASKYVMKWVVSDTLPFKLSFYDLTTLSKLPEIGLRRIWATIVPVAFGIRFSRSSRTTRYDAMMGPSMIPSLDFLFEHAFG